MAKTSKLRPHQRPIVTRFVFVMPLRQTPSGRMFDYVVPCEPQDATSFGFIEWHPYHINWETSKAVEALRVEDGDWEGPYEEARKLAQIRDEQLALEYGVER